MTSEYPTERNPLAGTFVRVQVEALRKAGIEVRVLDLRSDSSGPLKYLRWRRSIVRLVESNKPDLVHAHFGHVGALALTQSAAPVVTTFHGSDVFGLVGGPLVRLAGSFLRFISRWAARQSSAALAVSRPVANALPHSAKVFVSPLGIDTEAFHYQDQNECRIRLGWSDEPTVLFVGEQQNRIKNWPLANLVMQAARKSIPSIQLRAAWGLQPSQLATQMGAADALIVTSHHEGGPLVIPEALACGLPIVSVPVGLAPTLLPRIAECRLVDGWCPEALAEALVDVLRARARVRTSLAQELAADSLINNVVRVYSRVLSEGAVANTAQRDSKEHESTAHAFAHYDRSPRVQSRWSIQNAGNAKLVRARDDAMIANLKKVGRTSALICDLGCGAGQFTQIARGALPTDTTLIAADLLEERLRSGQHEQLAGVPTLCADAASLPFQTASLDAAICMTIFSSMLDPNTRRQVADELARVLRPGGAVLWYDLRVTSPLNRRTRGVSRRELASLFPSFTIEVEPHGLIPQLARSLEPRLPGSFAVLSQFRPLRSHLIGIITKILR